MIFGGKTEIPVEHSNLTEMPVAQSSGLDNLLLIISTITMILACFTIIGIIPVIILASGLILSVKTGNIGNVRATTRFLQIVGLLGAAGFFVAATQEEYPEEVFLFFAGGCVIAVLGLSICWLGPISRQLSNLQRLFGSQPASDVVEKRARIMDRDGLAPFSVADELQKWAQLRADSVVSEEEFQTARERILHGS